MSYLAHSAKPAFGISPQVYADHVANVVDAAVRNARGAAQYSARYSELLQASVRLAAEFHDLGKLDEQNQQVLQTGRGHLPINHVDAGVAHLLAGKISRVHQVAAILIFAHHIGLPSMPKENNKGAGNSFRSGGPNPTGGPLKAYTDGLVSEYWRRHGSVVESLAPVRLPEFEPGVPPVFLRMALSCLVDADHSDTARHYHDLVAVAAPQLGPDRRLRLLDRYVKELALGKTDARTRLRSLVYQKVRDADVTEGMVACDSPVGSGKTTAVMAHLLKAAEAAGLRRIIVVLPFTNIIDQSVGVYRKALVGPTEDPVAVVAAHHHRAVFDDPASRQYTYLWRAPVIVTTAVQFFETLAAGTPGALRKLHEVPGSAIFIDESHAALPTHLWPQAWRWLRELERDWSCRVVFGSGSLCRFWGMKEFVDPPARLPELAEHSVRESSMSAEHRRIRYQSHPNPLDLEGLIGFVGTLPGPRLLIVNTVQSAAAIARRLADFHGGRRVTHLSTALTPYDRSITLEQVKRRLKQATSPDWTLVATSCVEAGVDISFRTGIRERCGLTNLLQTAGRVNRAEEWQNATVWDVRLKHDHLLRPHPAFSTSATILKELFDEQKVAPEFCTEALRREIRQDTPSKVKEMILRAERNADFPSVEELFRVIDSNTVTAVVDPALIQRLEHGHMVSADELQSGSVQVYRTRAQDWGVQEFADIPGLFRWCLPYDPFLGYMKGVLQLVDAAETGFIV